jgi:hypothetical protein
MSGGSHNYLYSRASDEMCGLASEIEQMADAIGDGFPSARARTSRVALLLREAATEAVRLSDLWKAVEWHQSGDWGRYRVRSEAAKAGEHLPQCGHDDKRRCVGAQGPFRICETCGEEFPIEEKGGG